MEKKTIRERDQAGQQKARDNLSVGEKKIIRERDQAGQQKARDNSSAGEKKAIRERDQAGQRKVRANLSEKDRLKKFNCSVIFSPIFVCICSHQEMFGKMLTNLELRRF